ncbi:DUF4396 domain-containing protein [Cucumibacter marinus]|uniref:DUF4396 domain-containing protein n=1 Tax=Cucumibacter marinus TaxID=1121252 RepID=UPI00041625A8|nr:DUF4396 domain-containing protein [Cucumibacter marinus]
MEGLRAFFSNPYLLIGWAALMVPSLAILIVDLRRNNSHLMGLMKLVWGLTVAYSGPVGLGIYWLTGRKSIPDDKLWRRAFRSVAHCYSGCGLGEITGVLIAAGLLALGNLMVAAITFVLAYVTGFALTVGPLVQEGTSLRDAFRDAVYAETPSIAVMEIVAIVVELTLAGDAGMGDPIFWTSLIVSLTIGLAAAYPVNLALLHFGIKEGMMDPRQHAET